MHTPFGELPPALESASMADQYEYLRGRLSRRSFVKGAALAGLAAPSPSLWLRSAPAAPQAPVWRHVSFSADPRHEAVVSFGTPGSFRKAVVEYGLDKAYGSSAPVDVRTVHGSSTRYGHAMLPALQPGEQYQYRVRLDDVVSKSGTVQTAPATPRPFVFTAFGDQGVSQTARRIMARLLLVNPVFHLLAGDICYANATGDGKPNDVFNPKIWDTWLQMIRKVAENTAWLPTAGNHDMEPGYGPLGYDGWLDRVHLPANGPADCPSTYSFVYGNVGVISLDANDVSFEITHNLDYSQGHQTIWLNRQLAAWRTPGSGVEFIVAFFHHCAFSTNTLHGSDGGVRDNWVPLFDKHAVDLVINGHAHLYERTTPLRYGKITERAPRGARVDSTRGTTYITAGGGGATVHGAFEPSGAKVVRHSGMRTPEDAAWSVPTRTIEHAFLEVTVTPSTGPTVAPTMHVRTLNEHGDVLDEVTLARPAPAKHAPVEASTSGPMWVAGAGAGVVLAAGAAIALRGRLGRPAAEAPVESGVESPVGSAAESPVEPAAGSAAEPPVESPVEPAVESPVGSAAEPPAPPSVEPPPQQ